MIVENKMILCMFSEVATVKVQLLGVICQYNGIKGLYDSIFHKAEQAINN